MNRPPELAISLLFTLLSLNLGAAEPDARDEKRAESSQSIIVLRARFNEAIAQHDAAGIAAYLDNPYQITTSDGGQYQSTPEEEAAAWSKIFREKPGIVYVRTPDAVEVSSFLDSAAESGTWVGRWNSPDGGLEVSGKYFAQWRKVDNDWKIRAEVFVGLYCNGEGC